MSVTAVGDADLDALVPLFAGYLQFYQVPRSATEIHAFLLERLQRGDAQLFIARDEQGMAQGFTQLYPLQSSLALAPAWLLSDLFVLPSARRQGVGEALMNAARAYAEARGACGLQLETAKTNLAGQALYERLGYVRDELYLTYWLSLANT
ncbi:MAG: GNAT family N-acetyltransferase [Pseudomonadaceae bacterium]|uniref:GNAT family N-acetyltransferase n=1 Tax=Pseudomonas sp. TaxID=306 RepID=UPI002CA00A9D|nr:GNAT family N-acetyltransferase [Pseudomonas sp.]MBX9712344.1 GNAT family N-acetyltransferase [Pseudomonadaceae bacterium]HRL91938.1 GNAT family N-acetyltransferase [Pseudomonas sp.]